MKYQFSSIFRNHGIQGVGEFQNYIFQTDSDEVANKLRKNADFGLRIFECKREGEVFSLPEPVRKNVKAKAKVVSGMRTSEVNERENE